MRRLLAAACALVTALALGVGPATAQDEPTVIRLAGATRIETAIAIATDAFAGGEAEVVVLARSDRFPDALAGGPLAAARRGPLLLTPTDQLAAAVETELQRVLPVGAVVYLLGGEAALAPAVADRVTELGYEVRRLAGPSRYDTALAIAREAAPEPGFITIADGNEFPDALIGGSLVTPFTGGVMVLSNGEELPGAVRDYLDANADADMTTIGPAAGAAFPGVFNVDGPTPAERSVVAAETFYQGTLAPGGVALASVAAFPDGLAGAAHAFRSDRIPLLLTPPDGLPQSHRDYVAGLDAAVPSYVYGGQDAINEVVVDQLREALAR